MNAATLEREIEQREKKEKKHREKEERGRRTGKGREETKHKGRQGTGKLWGIVVFVDCMHSACGGQLSRLTVL